MSQIVRVDSFKALEREITKDLKRTGERVQGAIRETARDGAAYVRRHVPVAFGPLRDSIHATTGESPAIVADSPHAAPAETGSRPHTPPLAPLVAWVKLRGMQGISGRDGKGPSSRLPGTTTRGHASSVAGQLAADASATGYADISGGASSISAPERVARAIQAGIRKHGTKPHWYMRDSVPEVRKILARNMEKAIHSTGGEGG